MRFFGTPLEAVKEVERDLFEMGTRIKSKTVQDRTEAYPGEFDTLEILSYGYTITKPASFELVEEVVDYMKLNLTWIKMEFNERISLEYYNPGNAYLIRSDFWSRYLHDGRFAYTYNERYRDQLDQVIDELITHPETRQAVLTVYDKHMDLGNRGGQKRVPCSMYTQFFVRGDQLHSIYTMRSCDFLKHFAYDMILSLRLNEYIAQQIDVSPGPMTHVIGSLHAFYSDLKERGIF